MKELRCYQIDAFADQLFSGNPAVVCPLHAWLTDKVMQSIAMENNQSETAFYVQEADGFRIRWFTPTVEVDLCGHATLATADVLFFHEGYSQNTVTFNSRSGPLTVDRSGELLMLNFPCDIFREVDAIPEIEKSLGAKPVKTFQGKTDYMVVFDREEEIAKMKPDFKLLATVKTRGIIVTAKGNRVDFVSRFFAPQSGVDEDPVTGSAHVTLAPYWSSVLRKNELHAQQLSLRGGKLVCELKNDRVLIGGKAKLYSAGKFFLD